MTALRCGAACTHRSIVSLFINQPTFHNPYNGNAGTWRKESMDAVLEDTGWLERDGGVAVFQLSTSDTSVPGVQNVAVRAFSYRLGLCSVCKSLSCEA